MLWFDSIYVGEAIINVTKTGQIICPYFPNIDLKNLLELIKTSLESIVIIIVGIWGIFKILEFREFKHWIQFEVDVNLYPLSKSIYAESFEWDEYGKRSSKHEAFTHVLNILFKFNNKGKTRVKIYNIHAKISTLPPLDNIYLSKEDNHLRFFSTWTGNIVPKSKKFYYIEPQVEQTITYLTLIAKPRDLIRIHGEFCQDHNRIYPNKENNNKYCKYNKNIVGAKFRNSEEDFLLIRYFRNISFRLCNFLQERYIFCWDEVPGKDTGKLIDFLLEKFLDIKFIKNGEFVKSDDKNSLIFESKNNRFRLELALPKTYIDKSNKLTLKINNIKRGNRLFLKIENDINESGKRKIKIYENGRYDPYVGWFYRQIYNWHCRRLLSHTAERTIFLDSNGVVRKD
jgi:hypothetical protein